MNLFKINAEMNAQSFTIKPESSQISTKIEALRFIKINPRKKAKLCNIYVKNSVLTVCKFSDKMETILSNIWVKNIKAMIDQH